MYALKLLFCSRVLKLPSLSSLSLLSLNWSFKMFNIEDHKHSFWSHTFAQDFCMF